MGGTRNISVLDTPKWTPRQALLSALNNSDEAQFLVVAYKDKDGCWQSIIGSHGGLTTGELLVASEIVRRRALQSMEGYLDGFAAIGDSE